MGAPARGLVDDRVDGWLNLMGLEPGPDRHRVDAGFWNRRSRPWEQQIGLRDAHLAAVARPPHDALTSIDASFAGA